MRKSLAKSIYFGAAALAFAGIVGTTSTTANAATAAKITSNKTLTTAATSRNVTLTGTNAVYTKAGTLKGAKVVASTTTAAKLAKSTSGSANFRAYKVATTNRGSVYYKVVSFDGTYRGWVYGGKSTSKFAGGVDSYDTTKAATTPSSDATFKFTNAGSSTATYKEPAYAQYKVGRSVKDTSAYKDTTFTVSAAETTSREGETWYQIKSTISELNGTWVKASDTTQTNADATATNDNSVLINYVDGTTNVGSARFITATTGTKSGDSIEGNKTAKGLDFTDFAEANIPSGYTLTGTNTGWSKLTFGSTVTVTVTKTATSKASFYAKDSDNVYTSLSSSDFASGYPTLTATQQKVFTGASDTSIPDTVYAGLKNSFGTYYSNGFTQNGQTVYYKYTYDPEATYSLNGNDVKYGSTVKLVFDRSTVTSVPSTTTETGNTDYVG